jgi:HPt (histidine-containing phosphotransfer) domain-containing protein
MADGRGLDPTYLQDLAESGGESFVRDVVRTFLETVPPRVAILRAALGASDYAEASRAAHSIVSSAAMVGLTDVQETARGVESLAAQGGPVPPHQVTALDRALADAPALLEQGLRVAVKGKPGP